MAQKFKMFKQNCVIPVSSPANIGVPFIFKHPSTRDYRVVGMGLVEVANASGKHYNFGLEAVLDSRTLDDVSKKFYEATNQSPVNDRFLPIEFDIPQDEQSRIYLTPTEALTSSETITAQVVFKYQVKE